ncbi:MAG TPA: FAD-dependent monooxygenase [Pseudomonadales bacterium]|nr:FAD-dependent monooxygenase [Pseudomonadales bacterium]
MTTPDVVIVGGGIGGGALAKNLAEAGVTVLVLERTLQYVDVVRGEWIAPWGVPETKAVGVYPIYLANGGHHVTRHVSYDEDVAPRVAEKAAFDLTTLLPDNPGPLCIGHPSMCNLLNQAATAAGATTLRGVSNTRVTPGSPPTVTFDHDGKTTTLRPRLVVGADGRHGKTAEQIGAKLQQDDPHHRFSGMLVDNVPQWREDTQFISVEGDVNVLAFPQGGGRIRLYIGFGLEQKTRLAGPQGPQRFLEAFRLKSVPGSEAIAAGRPIGPCLVYPNNDTWIDEPFAEGVVLIGDAAGRNDPITGQGLSITHRDVRIVRDILLGEANWSTDAFVPYGAERKERMRRLRISARIAAILEAEFDAPARARRHRAAERRRAMAPESLAILTPFIGPDALPPEPYSDEAVAAFLA